MGGNALTVARRLSRAGEGGNASPASEKGAAPFHSMPARIAFIGKGARSVLVKPFTVEGARREVNTMLGRAAAGIVPFTLL